MRAKKLAVRSIEFHECNLHDFQKAFAEAQIPIDFSTLTYNDIKQYFIGNMLDRKLAGNTINGRIKSCKAFLQFLYREHAIATNLGEQLKLVKIEQKMIWQVSRPPRRPCLTAHLSPFDVQI
ncbi:MAG: site-specific integrase, partial [Paenibacillaceae bacterium]